MVVHRQKDLHQGVEEIAQKKIGDGDLDLSSWEMYCLDL